MLPSRYNNTKEEHETSTAANTCKMKQASKKIDQAERMRPFFFPPFFPLGHSAASRNVWLQHQVPDGIRQVKAWIDGASPGH